MESTIMLMALATLANGKTIISTDMVRKHGLTAVVTMAIIVEVKSMDKANTGGKIGQSMKESGATT